MFLSVGIEGSAAMVQRLGNEYAGAAADCHRLIRGSLAAHGG
jgi:hypothetical protein